MQRVSLSKTRAVEANKVAAVLPFRHRERVSFVCCAGKRLGTLSLDISDLAAGPKLERARYPDSWTPHGAEAQDTAMSQTKYNDWRLEKIVEREEDLLLLHLLRKFRTSLQHDKEPYTRDVT